jgi:hypothetical protein
MLPIIEENETLGLSKQIHRVLFNGKNPSVVVYQTLLYLLFKRMMVVMPLRVERHQEMAI